MCRTKSEGGRRCPSCSNPSEEQLERARAAKRDWARRKATAEGRVVKPYIEDGWMSPLATSAPAVLVAVGVVGRLAEAAELKLTSSQAPERVAAFDHDVYRWAPDALAQLPGRVRTAAQVAHSAAYLALSEDDQEHFLDLKESDGSLWLAGLPDA